jgi:IclR family mhp operon transcriptional activator
MASAIQPISRALQVLVALNRRPLTSIDELHRDTGLPKPSLVRLLQALIADGYVEQISRTAGYRLSAKVLMLTSGYRQRDLLVDVARPLMEQFTRQHKWPLYLGTLEDMTMWVRYSTAEQSLVAPDYLLGYHQPLSLLVSALGKAYLAFCPAAERRQLLSELIGTTDIQDGLARDAATVQAMLVQAQKKGYATTASILGDRGRGIAVPVRQGRRVIAALSMRHFRSTLNEAQAAQRYLEPLQELAAAIGAGLKQAQQQAKQQGPD